ncbi:MAG: hypothetical protein IPL48_10095 [Bacteroidetes bacterium]|nr:hypothetical protein [Bacteroidota bacterium]
MYAEELGHRLSDGELTADSLIAFPDSLKYFTSGDRIVYGGGGIMPDIYIALDTSWATDYYAQVVGKGIVNQFALEYINDNRNEFKTMYPTPFDFNSKFEVNKEVWDKFFKYAEGEEVPYDEEQYKTCEMKLTQILKASLARDLYDFEAFWIVYNSYDDAYKKAIESLNDDTFSKMKIAVN